MCSVQENSSSTRQPKVRKIMLQIQPGAGGAAYDLVPAYSERCVSETTLQCLQLACGSLCSFLPLSLSLLWLRMDSDKQLVAPHPPTASAQSQRLLQVSLSQAAGQATDGWMDGIKMWMDGWRGTMIRCVPHTMIKSVRRRLLLR